MSVQTLRGNYLECIMYSCKKFHTYLYGRTFLVETDHKPLEMISIKDLITAPVRLQRMLLWLQQYDMTITYRPGKEMLLADALSHLPLWTDTQIKLDLRVDAILISTFTRSYLMKIAAETYWDPILSTVCRLTLNGWPGQMHKHPQNCQKLLRFQRWTLNWGWPISWKLNESSSHLSCRDCLSWMISTKAMQESTRPWPWQECVFTGQEWKLMWQTISRGAWHASRAVTFP